MKQKNEIRILIYIGAFAFAYLVGCFVTFNPLWFMDSITESPGRTVLLLYILLTIVFGYVLNFLNEH